MKIDVVRPVKLRARTNDSRFVDVFRRIVGNDWNSIVKSWEFPISSTDDLLNELVRSGLVSIEKTEEMRKTIEDTADYRGINVDDVLKEVKIPLRPYQIKTLQFFKHRGSALGALPVALGKTLVSLTYIRSLLKNGEIKKALVLCPRAVRWHWVREVEKFFGDKMTAVVVGQEIKTDGSSRNRQRKERLKIWNSPYDIYIANYEQLRDLYNIETLPAIGKGRPRKVIRANPETAKLWDGNENNSFIVIADEVTKIKTQGAQRTRLLKSVPAKFRIGLSGRPLENRLDELYTIIDWIWPGSLGSYTSFKTKHIIEDEYQRPMRYVDVEDLKKKLKWVTIYFSKAEVLPDLPSLIRSELQIDLSDEELEEYGRIREEAIKSIKEIENATNPSSKGRQVLSMLAWVTIARMYVDHPLLVSESNSDSAKAVNVKCKTSSKMNALMEYLEEVEGQKVVIFSQYRRMIDILEKEIAERFPITRTYKLVGGMKNPQEPIDAFKKDPVGGIFLSTDAGAYGIELQCAHIMIHYEEHYNPAVMDQREGRIHRPGLTEAANAVNLICTDQQVIERRVREVLDRKNLLYADVMGGLHES